MFKDLIEYSTYSTGTQLKFTFLLFLPALIVFLIASWTRDAILTLSLLILVYLIAIAWMYQIDRIIFTKAFYEDMGQESARATTAAGAALGSALLFGLALWVYLKFIPVGPTEIAYLCPIFSSSAKETTYYVFMCVLWLVSSGLEVAFFISMQASCYSQWWNNQLISFAYSLMNFCWIIFVFKGFLSVLFLTLWCWLLCLFLISCRDAMGTIVAGGIRLGICLGMVFGIVYIRVRFPQVATPKVFAAGMSDNVFS